MTKELKQQIYIKAKWVNKRFPELTIPDLMQEAEQLITTLDNGKGKNNPYFYCLAAVGHHFRKLMKGIQAERSAFVDVNDDSILDRMEERVTDAFEEVENNIDRLKFFQYLNDETLKDVLYNLCMGDKPEEIAQKRKCSVRQVYRYIENLKVLRKGWDK